MRVKMRQLFDSTDRAWYSLYQREGEGVPGGRLALQQPHIQRASPHGRPYGVTVGLPDNPIVSGHSPVERQIGGLHGALV